jgi:hypothetical protein
MSERKEDRQQVLAAVFSSIEQRMDGGSVDIYVDLARAYGKKYAINEGIIQDWLMEGREQSHLFGNVEFAKEWANSLP